MTTERKQTVVGWLETAESDLAYALKSDFSTSSIP